MGINEKKRGERKGRKKKDKKDKKDKGEDKEKILEIKMEDSKVSKLELKVSELIKLLWEYPESKEKNKLLDLAWSCDTGKNLRRLKYVFENTEGFESLSEHC